jgi:predicted ferric reductase
MISRKSLYYQALFKILFSLHLVVISLLWWQNSASLLLIGGAEAIISLARLLGLLGGTAIMLQLLFIGRIAFIEKAFGFDHLNQWHRWIGYSILIFFLGHFFLLLYGYGLLNNTGMWQQLLFYLQTGDYFNAFASLLLFLFIISISLPFTRRRMRYEVWHGFHLLLYVALFLSIDHQTLAGDLSLGHPMQICLDSILRQDNLRNLFFYKKVFGILTRSLFRVHIMGNVFALLQK